MKKPISYRYIWVSLLAFLVACSKQTVTLPAATSTIVLPTVEITATFLPIIPSPLPTEPIIPMITPDPVQAERWEEYEDALAAAIFSPKYISQSPSEFLCEWEILGQAEQEVYVWATCMSTFHIEGLGLHYHGEMPAVIHISADEDIQNVETPGGGSNYASDIRQMFPPAAQEKYFNRLIHFQALTDHLKWRLEHLGEPPLVVLSITPTP